MSRWRAVVFDIGGTLVQTGDYVERAYLEVFGCFGIAPERIALSKQFSGRAKRFLFEAALGPIPDRDERVRACMQAFERVLVWEAASLEEVPGASRCLEALERQGKLVALASGFPRAAGAAILRRFGWSYPLVCDEDVPQHRPAPDPVVTACALLGTTPAETLVVGDTPNDILSARRAGATSVAVTSGKFAASELAEHGPHVVLDSVAELSRLFDAPSPPPAGTRGSSVQPSR